MTLKDLESKLLALTATEKVQVIKLLTENLASIQPEIAQPPEILGGEARIANTQIAIWELVNAKELGCNDDALLQIYPQLTAVDLATAWDYADAHAEEISLALQEINE